MKIFAFLCSLVVISSFTRVESTHWRHLNRTEQQRLLSQIASPDDTYTTTTTNSPYSVTTEMSQSTTTRTTNAPFYATTETSTISTTTAATTYSPTTTEQPSYLEETWQKLYENMNNWVWWSNENTTSTEAPEQKPSFLQNTWQEIHESISASVWSSIENSTWFEKPAFRPDANPDLESILEKIWRDLFRQLRPNNSDSHGPHLPEDDGILDPDFGVEIPFREGPRNRLMGFLHRYGRRIMIISLGILMTISVVGMLIVIIVSTVRKCQMKKQVEQFLQESKCPVDFVANKPAPQDNVSLDVV